MSLAVVVKYKLKLAKFCCLFSDQIIFFIEPAFSLDWILDTSADTTIPYTFCTVHTVQICFLCRPIETKILQCSLSAVRKLLITLQMYHYKSGQAFSPSS